VAISNPNSERCRPNSPTGFSPVAEWPAPTCRDQIPPEALAESTPSLPYSILGIGPASIDGAAIEEAADLVTEAKNPAIWAGGGGHSSGASETLQRFAEYLQIPILTTPEGKGPISDKHYLSLGTPKEDPPAKALIF
jgi:hypothetical protein